MPATRCCCCIVSCVCQDSEKAEIGSHRRLLSNTSYDQETNESKVIYTKPTTNGLLVARCNFRNPDCLQVNKNDKISVVETCADPEWTHVENLTTMERGYLPTCLLVYENSLQNEDWYFGDVTRLKVEGSLLQPSTEEGTFLIRKAKPGADFSFVLSVRSNTKGRTSHVLHYKIYLDASTKMFRFSGDSTLYHSLAEIVDTYSKCNYLKQACSVKEYLKPVLYSLSPKYALSWSIPKEELSNMTMIERGRDGQIYKAKWKDYLDVIIKMNVCSNNEETLREINIMRKLRHDNVVQIYGHSYDWIGNILIVMEYLENGNLRDYIINNLLTARQKLFVSSQIVDGMEYLETHNIIHRDVAARNMFVGDNLVVKVGDYGLSRITCHNDEVYIMLGQYTLPIKWLAPECLDMSNAKPVFTTKSDVWAFGVLMVELYTKGGVPYPNYNNWEAYKRIRNGEIMDQPAEMNDFIYNKIVDCWATSPQDRPSFADLKKFFEMYEEDGSEASYDDLDDINEVMV